MSRIAARIAPRLTYANIVSTIALVAVLGGAAWAAPLPRGSVNSATIADRTIRSIDLAPGAVTTAVLGTNSVRTSRIGDGAVTATKLGSGAVTSAKLGSGAVTEAKLGSGAVTSAKLGSGAVTEAKLGAGAVSTSKIGPDAVTTAAIDDGAVTVAKLDSGVREAMDGTWFFSLNNPGAVALTGSFVEKLGGSTYIVPEDRALFLAQISVTATGAGAEAECRLVDSDSVSEIAGVMRGFAAPAAGATTTIQMSGMMFPASDQIAPSIECRGANANVTSLRFQFVGLGGAEASIVP